MLYVNHFPPTKKHQSNALPTLVFLHGLLGNGQDWQACIDALPHYERVSVDLPGHGKSHAIDCLDLDDCCAQLQSTLLSLFSSQQPFSSQKPLLSNKSWILIGYSMGGRIAMHGLAHHRFSQLNIQAAIIEGGNFGLQTEAEKQARHSNDAHWAKRFRDESIECVLSDWYQQLVFSSLNHAQRQTLITKRSANLGFAVARMLLATSLAKQAYLLPMLRQQAVAIYYLCGGKDKKFTQLAEQSGLAYWQIEGAGHNAHHEQPEQFARHIEQIIHTHFGELNENNGNHHG